MKLKELRLSTNYNQTQLAKILNIPRVNYNKYELGNVKPDIETLIKIANYYNVSLDYLCDRPWNNKIGYIPESKTELINNVLSLNDNETKELMIFIRGLKAGRSSSTDFKVFN